MLENGIPNSFLSYAADILDATSADLSVPRQR
jgi:hypothetical protein